MFLSYHAFPKYKSTLLPFSILYSFILCHKLKVEHIFLFYIYRCDLALVASHYPKSKQSSILMNGMNDGPAGDLKSIATSCCCSNNWATGLAFFNFLYCTMWCHCQRYRQLQNAQLCRDKSIKLHSMGVLKSHSVNDVVSAIE